MLSHREATKTGLFKTLLETKCSMKQLVLIYVGHLLSDKFWNNS